MNTKYRCETYIRPGGTATDYRDQVHVSIIFSFIWQIVAAAFRHNI